MSKENMKSPFDLVPVEGPRTFLKYVDSNFIKTTEEGTVYLLRDEKYAVKVAREFIKLYPDRKKDIISWNELKAFDEQRKYRPL